MPIVHGCAACAVPLRAGLKNLMSKQPSITTVIFGLALLMGCSRDPLGSNVASIHSPGFFCFACSNIEHTTKQFGRTRTIHGIIIHDGSLMQSQADLTNCGRRTFVLIEDRFLWGLVAGDYWELQSKNNALPGSPMMDSRPSKIILVEVDERKSITNYQRFKVAYVTIAADPADFGRPFTGYIGDRQHK
jgi:hypothetical protein